MLSTQPWNHLSKRKRQASSVVISTALIIPSNLGVLSQSQGCTLYESDQLLSLTGTTSQELNKLTLSATHISKRIKPLRAASLGRGAASLSRGAASLSRGAASLSRGAASLSRGAASLRRGATILQRRLFSKRGRNGRYSWKWGRALTSVLSRCKRNKSTRPLTILSSPISAQAIAPDKITNDLSSPSTSKKGDSLLPRASIPHLSTELDKLSISEKLSRSKRCLTLNRFIHPTSPASQASRSGFSSMRNMVDLSYMTNTELVYMLRRLHPEDGDSRDSHSGNDWVALQEAREKHERILNSQERVTSWDMAIQELTKRHRSPLMILTKIMSECNNQAYNFEKNVAMGTNREAAKQAGKVFRLIWNRCFETLEDFSFTADNEKLTATTATKRSLNQTQQQMATRVVESSGFKRFVNVSCLLLALRAISPVRKLPRQESKDKLDKELEIKPCVSVRPFTLSLPIKKKAKLLPPEKRLDVPTGLSEADLKVWMEQRHSYMRIIEMFEKLGNPTNGEKLTRAYRQVLDSAGDHIGSVYLLFEKIHTHLNRLISESYLETNSHTLLDSKTAQSGIDKVWNERDTALDSNNKLGKALEVYFKALKRHLN